MEKFNKVLPPGTILTLMYLKERLRNLVPGKFIEVGPGSSGLVSKVLIDLGWKGVAYELNHDSVEILNYNFGAYISKGQFEVKNIDWLKTDKIDPADLIISCMVLEHLSSIQEEEFIDKAYHALNKKGLLITIVPSSQKHWGIEDEIAGHFRRYSIETVKQLVNNKRWKIKDIQGLTYPLSNMLFPISNYLVKRNEKSKLNLSLIERTKQSGNRNVLMKTDYPKILKYILNEITLYPLHVFQKMFNYKNALNLYFEVQKND